MAVHITAGVTLAPPTREAHCYLLKLLTVSHACHAALLQEITFRNRPCQTHFRILQPKQSSSAVLDRLHQLLGILHPCYNFGFTQVIPHNFGRQRPPIIATMSAVEKKIQMCDVLSDIEVAQDLLEPKGKEEDRIELHPNPADEKYATLMADLKVMAAQEEEYKVIDKYCQVTHATTGVVLLGKMMACIGYKMTGTCLCPGEPGCGKMFILNCYPRVQWTCKAALEAVDIS